MRIVIDMQGAQSTGSRNRGIGRYAQALSQAIVRNKGDHEVVLALSGLFPDTIEPIRADFDGLLPQENIRVWSAPAPVSSLNADNDWRRKSAELVREAFLASLKPDVVLVTSLFEGLDDDAVTSIGTLSLTVPIATILYDLIPFIHRQPYLENPVIEAWYESKLDHLRRAGILLAISESSRQEGIRYLGFPEEISVNISTAADSHFQPKFIDSKQEAEIRERYNLTRSYVMYTGGIDHRKNIEGLICAYACLPKALRAQHQLAVVCAAQPHDRIRLEGLAKKQGLAKDELVLTGFVPEDDLLVLYNLCRMFVFPSWHEGFGLPALEAMSCGRAVIGANTSSVPEVIGREDALFDPRSDAAITAKLKQVLTDDVFRAELEKHGLEQSKKFTWDKSANLAIASLETFYAEHQRQMALKSPSIRRPRMAFVSPLPPERSGISDYSAELLPELSRHYDIDVIVAQDSVKDSWVNANCLIRDVEWFRCHSDRYERVLYHFGNSPFHQHMFMLLAEIPGVVVLHDFFLSSVVSHLDYLGLSQNGWEKELYEAHGYKALQERYFATDPVEVVWQYPCSLGALKGAHGAIVHSESSRRLAVRWYGDNDASDWAVVPLLRDSAIEQERTGARKALNLADDDFVICSFGLLGPTKLNHRLLEAWLASDLSKHKNCKLVFVGENHEGEYGLELLSTIKRNGMAKRITITGWADVTMFRQYLAAADIGVQLRTLTRGETSAAVLDCMNYSLPTIVNANGSMADLPKDAVWKLADDFSNEQLIDALETLWREMPRRERLAKNAREIILKQHAPRTCADQYFTVIENFYESSQTSIRALTHNIAKLGPNPVKPEALLPLAEAVSRNIAPPYVQKQLLLDISTLVQHDAGTGIQRVVRSILMQLLTNPPEGYRVEPVYARVDQGYHYARRFTLGYLNCPADIWSDDPVECRAGDIFLAVDLLHHVVISHRETFQQMRRQGVTVKFVVYDLLCILMPEFFDFGEDAGELHSRWLEVVAESDGALCISKSVANELGKWLECNGPERHRPFKIDWFHLGADVDNSVPSQGLPGNADKVIKNISSRPSFLTVGTIEPRKGQAQALAAFEKLWDDGVDANLVIIGKQGWKVDALIEKLRKHPELDKRLFWLDGISDEYLQKIYAASTCLIAPSVGEGFGLPLIEAAQYKKPIIARDIPVFREVAGEYAYYFSGQEPRALADAIVEWISLCDAGAHPASDYMPWLTWAESASQLLNRILKK
jgi:glycosyltransferase involved in cell wall biosynthesis